MVRPKTNISDEIEKFLIQIFLKISYGDGIAESYKCFVKTFPGNTISKRTFERRYKDWLGIQLNEGCLGRQTSDNGLSQIVTNQSDLNYHESKNVNLEIGSSIEIIKGDYKISSTNFDIVQAQSMSLFSEMISDNFDIHGIYDKPVNTSLKRDLSNLSSCNVSKFQRSQTFYELKDNSNPSFINGVSLNLLRICQDLLYSDFMYLSIYNSLNDFLMTYEMKIVDVPGDGLCFISCLRLYFKLILDITYSLEDVKNICSKFFLNPNYVQMNPTEFYLEGLKLCFENALYNHDFCDEIVQHSADIFGIYIFILNHSSNDDTSLGLYKFTPQSRNDLDDSRFIILLRENEMDGNNNLASHYMLLLADECPENFKVLRFNKDSTIKCDIVPCDEFDENTTGNTMQFIDEIENQRLLDIKAKKYVYQLKETENQKHRRKQKDAQKHEEKRESENPDQSKVRKQKDAQKHEQKRASENPDQSKVRKQKDAQKHEQKRASENPEQSKFRKQKDAQKHEEKRESETPDQSKVRKQKDAQKHEQKRESETPDQSKFRKQKDAQLHEQKRESETPDQSKVRKQKDAQKHEQKRESETPEQSKVRKQKDAQKHEQKRESETPEQSKVRKQKDAQKHEQKRESETPDQSKFRKQKDAQLHEQKRESETPEQSKVRKQKDAQKHEQKRESETPDQSKVRKQKDAQKHEQKRESETPEQSKVRKQKDAQKHEQKRESETPEQSKVRKQKDAQKHFEVYINRTKGMGKFYRDAYSKDGVDETLEKNQIKGLGSMNRSCSNCFSLNFECEAQKRKINDITIDSFLLCCSHGKVKLTELKSPPEILKKLLIGTEYKELSDNLFKYIRNFNSSFAFASVGIQLEKRQNKFNPQNTFLKLHGEICHRLSTAHPFDGEIRKYGQVYMLDTEAAIAERMAYPENNKCDAQLMKVLSHMFDRCNPYVFKYKQLREKEEEEKKLAEIGKRSIRPLRMYIAPAQGNQNPGRYNEPVANEIAVAFVPEGDNLPAKDREIIVFPRHNGNLSTNFSSYSEHCDPMTYPLLFPYGEPGFRLGMQHQEEYASEKRTKITRREYYRYRIAIRSEFSIISRSRKLFQQYILDAFLKVESSDLNYLRLNQKKLRRDSYIGLMDYVNRQAENANLRPGALYILPSSHTGCPRWYMEKYKDAMQLVKHFGKPSLFITSTCNTKWQEIVENLNPGEQPCDRPEVVSRVFHEKHNLLEADIRVNNLFGKCEAYVDTNEYQKRGLPHNHALVWLREEDKIQENEIDDLIMAEIPDELINPRLYALVKKFMIHGPCGVFNSDAKCMENGVCSKGYPKHFNETTKANVNGYPMYRRRDNGRKITIQRNNSSNIDIDNRWIVPYNPTLLLRYECHINAEICSSLSSVKYLFKYIFKGGDAANLVIAEQTGQYNWDEIKTHVETRYVSSTEAVNRLYEYPVSTNSHTIYRMQIHLPEQQIVTFVPEADIQEVLNAARCTMLTEWFEINKKGIDPLYPHTDPRKLLYCEMPLFYVWNKTVKKWTIRKRGEEKVIPRLYNINPFHSELFHLRMLLLHRRGATSFDDLKSVNGIFCTTFKEACQMLKLIDDLKEWDDCLSECIPFQMPFQLRNLFATICMNCSPSDELFLWNKYKADLSEDHKNKHYVDNIAENLALYDINNIFQENQKTNQDFSLPMPDMQLISPYLIIKTSQEYSKFSIEEHKALSVDYSSKLNNDQREIYDKVLEAVISNDDVCKTFFLDGPGGTGKTFLFTALIHFLRGRGESVVPVAHTGIAASLLDGGKTVHSTFNIPLNLCEGSISSIKPDSKKGRFLKNAKLIIWDEGTMSSKHAYDAINLLLQDIMQNKLPFGGKTVLIGGDFRQTLPVVRHGKPVDIISVNLKKCNFWKYVIKLKLTKNMRANQNEIEFKKYLIDMGDGKLVNHNILGIENLIALHPQTVLDNRDQIFATDEQCLIDHVYGDSSTIISRLSNENAAILCPKNEDVSSINESVLNMFPGEVKTYFSTDTIECSEADEHTLYDTDFINQQTPNGFPPHLLNVKVGCPIILLRNLNISEGLCNGTRLLVKSLLPNTIDAEIKSGYFKGNRVFIPRFKLEENEDLPFILKRRQFPIRLAFAMTINKSQGQTFDRIGIFLPEPVFSHGQLYVAFSRVRTFDCVKCLVINKWYQGKLSDKDSETYTNNVVFRSVLND